MTEYTDEEIIDKLLKACIEKNISLTSFAEKQLNIRNHCRQTERILNIIKLNDFADISHNDIIIANPKTKKIVGDGGYLMHLDRLNKRQEHLEKMQSIQDSKLLNEYTLTKWQKTTFWYWFVGAIIGGLMGFISLLGQLNLLHLPDLGQPRESTVTKSDSVSIHYQLDSSSKHQSK